VDDANMPLEVELRGSLEITVQLAARMPQAIVDSLYVLVKLPFSLALVVTLITTVNYTQMLCLFVDIKFRLAFTLVAALVADLHNI
jgi:hypothetical protein